MWESLARLLRRNPFAIFQILFWWARGRARLKQKLAACVQVDPAGLPYNEKFLAWLREEKKSGRKIILATASDLKMAQPVADYVGLFDEVLASNGKTNLRGKNKLRALTEKFGERGFDYAGNSSADFAVWRGARAGRRRQRQPPRAARGGRVAPNWARRSATIFPPGPWPGAFARNFSGAAVILRPLLRDCCWRARFQNSALRVLRGSRRR